MVVDDDEEDAMLLVYELERGGFDVRWVCVDTAEEMRDQLERGGWELVLSDCAMPRFSGREALAELHASGLDLPFIVVSGALREEDAVDALRAGAHDFIVKGRLARLLPAVERELREAELRRRQRETEARLAESEKLRALGLMAAGIAHDLRNIFTPLTLHTGLLRRILADHPVALRSLTKIDHGLAIGVQVIDRLSGFSRRGGGVETVTGALAELAREAVELCRHRSPPQVRLILDESSPTPPIRICPGEFTSALVNLIGNALDAVETSGTVTVRTGAGADGAYVEVVDDGPGIAKEVQARMLEPFFTTKPEGTGLGLAIVRAFVDRHGGKLSFETAPGAGTCVRMWFPTPLPAQAAPLTGAAGAASGIP
ncbi:Signal transduction histidine kinase [Nannocystis exedens]|uniref:histidine kinase n=2 Tax=Nannocystis exedens TaxID=54 RepID=A0A1I2FVJ2_9BACT|nr:hybrid sensor histidine kinase/response regulator [Nannocystis exedens]SFF08973.1 Signal transduction histidine kinase [Nannocystis exedens]